MTIITVISSTLVISDVVSRSLLLELFFSCRNKSRRYSSNLNSQYLRLTVLRSYLSSTFTFSLSLSFTSTLFAFT